MWNPPPLLLYHSYLPQHRVHNLVWWYSVRPTQKVHRWLKTHLWLINVFILCINVSHTSWAYKLSINLFGCISSRNTDCTQPQRDPVWNTLYSSHQALSETKNIKFPKYTKKWFWEMAPEGLHSSWALSSPPEVLWALVKGSKKLPSSK